MRSIIPQKNKKAQSVGLLVFLLIGIIVVFIFAVVGPPIANAFDDIAEELKEPEHFGESNVSVAALDTAQGLITPAFDQLIFITLVAIILGTFAIAIFSDFHPVALTLFIITMILAIIIAALLANAYEDVSENELIINKSEEFTLTNVIMGIQFPIIIFFCGVIGVVILMAKRGRLTSPV